MQCVAGGFCVADCLERCPEEMAVCVDDLLRHRCRLVLCRDMVDEQLVEDGNDAAGGKLVFGLFVCLRGFKDAIDSILDIWTVFTVLLLSEHDGDRAVGSSCSNRSRSNSHRKCCNGPVLVQ